MKTDKLSVGQSFKNYKSLCEFLGMPVKRGNSKNSQIKDLERYCNMSKSGHSINIVEVFETPLPRIDGRGGKSIYGDLLQLLITDYLLNSRERTVLVTRNTLLADIKMINSNYSFCSTSVPQLSRFTKIDEKTVYDFFNTSSSSFRYTFESSLDSLRNKALIMYEKVTVICTLDGQHIIAEEDVKEFILEVEKEALEELGYEELIQVRKSGQWDRFTKMVKFNIQENNAFNINYYYTSYKITVNESYIERDHNNMLTYILDELGKEDNQNQLNSMVCERLIENANNRKNNTKFESKMSSTRNSFAYIEDNKKLVGLLINSDSKDITGIIKNMKHKDNRRQKK